MALDPQPHLSTPLQRVLDRLTGVRSCGQGYVAHCPNTIGHANGDRHPSLTISQGVDGRALLHCHTGCDTAAVVTALGLEMADLFSEKGIRPLRLLRPNGRPREVAVYPYHDEDGVELYQAVRYEPKAFKQRRPNGQGGHTWNMQGVRYVPYRLPAILAAPGETAIYIVEGEKDAEALSALGVVATTNVAGAGKWRPEYAETLRGRPIVIVPDNDAVGAAHAEQVAAALAGVAASIRVVALPGLPEKGDVSDWLAAGGTREQLEALVAISAYLHIARTDEPENAGAPLPLFPVEVFPPAVRDYIITGAEAVGVPVDMIATPFLVFAGAALGNRHSVELKPGFQQGPTLYGAVVAPPGSAKSPAIALARHPLDVLQREAYEHFQAALEQYEAELQQWQDAKKPERGEKPERPTMEHYYTTDATMEAAGRMLADSPGVALYQDELVAWVKSCDAYRGGRGGDRQRWLSQWAGEPIKIDRRGADPLFIAHPCMPVVGGVQPDLLPELADEAGRRDGFIDRILWSAAPTTAAEWSDAEVSPTAKQAMVTLFRALRTSAGDRPVKLSPEARTRWVAWFNENAALTRETAGIAQGIYAKLPNQAARLALILHALQHPTNPPATSLSAETMADALELAEYYRAHAQAVLPYFNAPTVVRYVGLQARVRRILERAGGEWISRTEIYRKLGARTPADAITEVLSALAESGGAEQQQVETGHRPSEQWRWAMAPPEARNPRDSTAQYADMQKCPSGEAPAPNGHDPTTADHITLNTFLHTCIRAKSAQTVLADFYPRYVAHCTSAGRGPLSEAAVCALLPKFHVQVKPSATTGHTALVGVALRAEETA